MSGAAHNFGQEFWRPPEQTQASPTEIMTTEICPQCNTDFVVGARFCHVCGAGREAQPEIRSTGLARFLDFQVFRQSLGLNVAALIAFAAGLACVAAAVITGFVYTAATVLDWQAIQLWRLEWLLGAVAAFLAGVLVRRTT